jgi:hypothetical protein
MIFSKIHLKRTIGDKIADKIQYIILKTKYLAHQLNQ